MEIFLNTQSLHGQYPSTSSFQKALRRIMAMRKVAREFQRDIYCDGRVLSREIAPDVPVRHAIGRLSPDQRRAVMQWWTRGGPFWENDRQHDGTDWLECGDDIVTDEALGEAAYRIAMGADCDTVSFSPSDWTHSPLIVRWMRDDRIADELAVRNSWEPAVFRERLRSAEPPITSWHQLRSMAEIRCDKLTFGQECFLPLRGLPFSSAAATRISALLHVLHRFAVAFESDGSRSAEGHRLYQTHFTGGNAPFSDSSDTEKRKFGKDMEFRHPRRPDEKLSCTWHGKVRHMTLRIHFSWPVRANKPLYVMYVGQKITRT